MGILFDRRDTKPARAWGHPCPRCRSTDVTCEGKGLVPLPASPLVGLGGAHVAPVSEFRCHACGHVWEDVF